MIPKFQNGRTINYSGINKSAIANLKYIDNELIKAGYGYFQRLAILGNVQRESSGNPLAISSNGLWHGIIQWDKDRYRIQSNNAQEELKRQTALLLKELEKTGWSGATWKDQVSYAKSFRDSTDLNSAVDIFTRRFVRPGDINGEIQKRLAFAQQGLVELDDPEYDLETAKKVLPDSLINAWRRNPEKNHLPSGYTDAQNRYHYLKSAHHSSYPESIEYERTDPKTIHAMSIYGNADDYVSKFPVYSPVTSGVPESAVFNPYNFSSNLTYKPSVLKHQSGGLIYKPFMDNNESVSDGLVYTPFDAEELKWLSDYNSRFPIEPVASYFYSGNYNSKSETDTSDDITEEIVDESPLNFTEAEINVLLKDGSNEEKRRIAMKYLQQNLDLTKEQAAAIVGQWQRESHFRLNAENIDEKAGKNSSVKSSQYGIGIGQWTGNRHDAFVNYINTHGGVANLKTQLDFAIEEIKSNPDFLNNLRSAKTVEDASAYVYAQYVAAQYKNVKGLDDLYSKVRTITESYRKKHQEMYGRSSDTFRIGLNNAIESLKLLT